MRWLSRGVDLLTRPLVWVLLGAIRVYQLTLSKVLPPACRFRPSCSRYAYEALQRRGFFVGVALTVWRLVRCQPFCVGGHDPVPATGFPWRAWSCLDDASAGPERSAETDTPPPDKTHDTGSDTTEGSRD